MKGCSTLQAAGHGDNRIFQVQLLGRLLSTRHQAVEFRGRAAPFFEGFRKFLGASATRRRSEVVIVGAAVCVEIWKPAGVAGPLAAARIPHSVACFSRLSQ